MKRIKASTLKNIDTLLKELYSLKNSGYECFQYKSSDDITKPTNLIFYKDCVSGHKEQSIWSKIMSINKEYKTNIETPKESVSIFTEYPRYKNISEGSIVGLQSDKLYSLDSFITLIASCKRMGASVVDFQNSFDGMDVYSSIFIFIPNKTYEADKGKKENLVAEIEALVKNKSSESKIKSKIEELENLNKKKYKEGGSIGNLINGGWGINLKWW